MTTVFGRYLTRLIVSRIVLCLLGLTFFMLSLDLALNGEEAIDSREGDPLALVEYGLLRLPEIVSQLLAIAALIGSLAVLTPLIRNNELVALWNCGTSPFGIMRLLLPVGLVAGVLQFAVDDFLLPGAVDRLNDWAVGDYGKGQRAEIKKGPIWLRTGEDILRLPSGDIDGVPVRDVMIFQRDPDGQLTSWISAGEASYQSGSWLLRDVEIYSAGDTNATYVAAMDWDTSLALDSLTTSVTHPSELPFHLLSSFLDGSNFGLWPPFLYRTWYHERLAAALTPYLIIVLLFFLAQRFQRGGALGALYLNAIAFGFGYFVLDRACLALGEASLLPPLFAAWAPTGVLAAIAASFAFGQESHSGVWRSILSGRAVKREHVGG